MSFDYRLLSFWLNASHVAFLAVEGFALAVVLRYRRISPATTLMLVGLAGRLAASVASFLMFSLNPVSFSAQFANTVVLSTSLFSLVASVVFVAGLSMLLRDLHRRVALPLFKEPVDDLI